MSNDKKKSDNKSGKKGRQIKVIFTPLSILFYAAIGYFVYKKFKENKAHSSEQVRTPV